MRCDGALAVTKKKSEQSNRALVGRVVPMVPYDALVYLVDGEAQIRISGTDHDLKQGDMIVMPANQPHAVRASSRFKMVLTMIRDPEMTRGE
jgi:mannose-6-phosphate isomerase-like protein (cupin superfamily)